MNAVFADTSFYLALLSPRDAWHARAVQLSQALSRAVVVTEFVLLEVGNALSRFGHRQLFVDLVPHLQADKAVRIVPASADLFRKGYDLYARRPDKDWSLTDCTSFVVMQEEGLTDVLTADHHFAQAGFNVLLS